MFKVKILYRNKANNFPFVFRFKNIYSLNRHQKNHMEGQPYNCEICLRPFRHKRALKRHAHIHTNQLPYECEHCKKCFREKSYLKVFEK